MSLPRIARPVPLHPFLLAAFPVLFQYAHNVEYDVSIREVLPWVGLFVGGAAVVFVIVWAAVRKALSAALATSVVLILFFSYGPIRNALGGAANAVLLPAWGLLAAGGILLAVRSQRRLPALTRGLNAVAAILVLSNVATAGWFEWKNRETAPNVASDVRSLLGPPPAGAPPTGKPDIYYLMLEEYGGKRALADLFGFDNTPFYDALRERGFYVVEGATTNYAHTAHSLASSLNMQYVQDLLPATPSGDWAPLYDLIRDDQVPKFLHSRGYRYVHIGSWWTPTASNPQADVNVKMKGALSEFATTLLGTTAFQPIGDTFSSNFNFAKREYLRVLFEFDQLAKTSEVGGPKFVFGHVLIPHHPFVFDVDGRYVEQEIRESRTDRDNYIRQLQYANARVLELLDTLLDVPDEAKPVIVLQSDEGPYEGLNDGATATPRELEQHFGILNAYFFPRVDEPGLYPEITPVNRITSTPVFRCSPTATTRSWTPTTCTSSATSPPTS